MVQHPEGVQAFPNSPPPIAAEWWGDRLGPGEPQALLALSGAGSSSVRCGCGFHAFLSIPPSPHVVRFYHLLWVLCHRAHVPRTPFPGLSVPPQSALSRESGALFTEQVERGSQKAALAVTYFRSDRSFAWGGKRTGVALEREEKCGCS